MLKVYLFAALIATSLSAPSQSSEQQFINGFLAGIGANGNVSGSCSSLLQAVVNQVYKVSADFQTKAMNLQDVINDLNDMQTLINDYEAVNTGCNFSQLNVQLKKIFSQGGLNIVVQNYLANGEAIYTDYQEIGTCANDYYKCGEAYGDMFSKLVGWSLN